LAQWTLIEKEEGSSQSDEPAGTFRTESSEPREFVPPVGGMRGIPGGMRLPVFDPSAERKRLKSRSDDLRK
jgi:hypothetical protein